MITSPPWTAEDWRRTAAAGDDLLLHSALRLGLNGDVKSLTTLMELGLADASGGNPGLSQVALELEATLSIPARPGTQAASKDAAENIAFNYVTLMMTVAMALSKDPQTRNPVTRDDIYDLLQIGDLPLRQTWDGDDEKLARLALRLWKGDEQALSKFFLAGARFANHPGFVQAFIDEGVGPRSGLDVLSAHHDYMICPCDDTKSSPCALSLMVRTGNVAGVARFLENTHPNHPGEVDGYRTDARLVDASIHGILRDLFGKNDRVLSGLVNRLIDDREVALRLAGGVADARLRDLPRATVSMFDELSCWDQWSESGRQPWVVRAHVLLKYLDWINDEHHSADPVFVEAMFHGNPKKGPTLAQVFNDPKLFESEDVDVIGTLSGLIYRAGASHCACVLAGAGGYIAAMTPGNQGSLIECVAMAGRKPDHKARLNTEDFRDSLRALESVGLDVYGPIRVAGNGKQVRSTLLHALAESQHKDTCSAMVVALEEGADPHVRNERNWLAASCVSNKDRKQQWALIEKSFLARKAAQAAVCEIMENGLR